MKVIVMIVVSFTTLPGRLNSLEPLIKNLVSQSRRPDKIILYLPSKYKRFPDEPVIVPEFFNEYLSSGHIEIHRIDDDYGPVTKLLPALREFTSPNDVIITIDDDVLLESHAIEELLDAHSAFCAMKNFCDVPPILGFMGAENNTFCHGELLQARSGQLRAFKEITKGVLGGYRGVLYPRRSIPDEIFTLYGKINELHEPQGFPMMDDDYFIGMVLRQHQRKMFVIGTFYPGNLSSKSIYEVINIKLLRNEDGVSSSTKIHQSRVLIDQVFS